MTVFLVTDLVENGGWYWWDVITHSFTETGRREVSFDLSVGWWKRPLADKAARLRASLEFTECLKSLPDSERRDVLSRLPGALDLEIPARAPERYAPMTWDEVGRCREPGVTFGPHTTTHPILARASDQQARSEIRGSWEAVLQHTDQTVPVFCYPNGDPSSFGDREIRLIRECGLAAALATVEGYCSVSPGDHDGTFLYKLPRFPYVQEHDSFVQVISGLERAKRGIRKLIGQL